MVNKWIVKSVAALGGTAFCLSAFAGFAPVNPARDWKESERRIRRRMHAANVSCGR